jgi:RNA polymerase sigma-70 factor (ECF subfamily)
MFSRAGRNGTGAVTLEWKIGATERTAAAPAYDQLGDAALARACTAGAREAFDVLVERHRRQIYRLCYRYAGNHEDAADFAQEVFLRAYRGLHRFKGESALATWLYRIAVNVCLRRVASKSPPSEPLDDDRVDLSTSDADPVQSVLGRERARQVRRAIACLPPRQRTVLVLRVYQDLPHREIARVLGSSVGAVKANFFHALRNLRKLLEES